MLNAKKDVLRAKSMDFALAILDLSRYLIEDRKNFILGNQIMRSGTSVGACIREAGNAESKADMAHKFAIAQKESDETSYWHELLFRSGYLAESEYIKLNTNCIEILKLLKASIITLNR